MATFLPRREITARVNVEGHPVSFTVFDHITIDDVLITEAKVQAYYLAKQDDDVLTRRVDRKVKERLLRLGVER